MPSRSLQTRFVLAIFSGLSLLFGLMVPVRAMGEDQPDWSARGRELLAIVLEQFYDHDRAQAWSHKHGHYADSITSAALFHERTNTILNELKTSHTGYYTPDDPGYHALLSIFRELLKQGRVETDSIGVDVAPGGFVRSLFAEGPAEKAGLKRGDRILGVDGNAFQPLASFRNRAAEKLTLSVQTQQGEPPHDLKVIPRRMDLNKEWLDAQTLGSKLIRRGTKSIAYIPMFAASGEEYMEAVRDAFNDQLANADALILDFRNGWGGANPSFLNLFDKSAPFLVQTDAKGKSFPFRSSWIKPLFVLINEGSRSGKEVVAYAIKKHKLGVLIGTKTAGAVVGGRPFLLADRSLLYLAVTDVKVDGERLEGIGVVPDVEVADPLPYAAGADPQLEKAIELAVGG